MSLNLPDDAQCLRCGYTLHGLQVSRCPECGRPFDPADLRSYRLGPERKWIDFHTPPGRWHYAALLWLVMLDPMSQPAGGMNVPFGCFVLPILPLVGLFVTIDYLVRIAIRLTDSSRRASSPEKPARGRHRWVILPLCAILLISAGLTEWPLRLRFRLSRGALERAAKAALAGRPPHCPRLIGAYYVERVMVSGTVVEIVTGQSIIDPTGFEYNDAVTTGDAALAPKWRAVEW
ncbi:hypothetical protein RAS1_31810 [Phycisphaerae bacterium RAS1]|nr:hypothetical protein RAS1_31810 [Phycisphaerae bacterium RAS1]